MANQEERAMPLTKLVAALDPAVRKSVRRRFDAMIRELKYLQTNHVEDLTYLEQKDWKEQKLEVLFVLNSVYQLAIGPLHASARATVGLGLTIPIAHGSDLFDRSRALKVNEMMSAYKSLVEALSIRPDWLTKNTTGDLLYWIARREREAEGVIYE